METEAVRQPDLRIMAHLRQDSITPTAIIVQEAVADMEVEAVMAADPSSFNITDQLPVD